MIEVRTYLEVSLNVLAGNELHLHSCLVDIHSTPFSRQPINYRVSRDKYRDHVDLH